MPNSKTLDVSRGILFMFYKWSPSAGFAMADLKTHNLQDMPKIMMKHMSILSEIQEKVLARKNKWAEEHCVSKLDLPLLEKTRLDLHELRRELLLLYAKRKAYLSP